MNKASKLITVYTVPVTIYMVFTYCLVTLPTVEVGFVSPYWVILVSHCRQQASCFKPLTTEETQAKCSDWHLSRTHPSTKVQCIETPTAWFDTPSTSKQHHGDEKRTPHSPDVGFGVIISILLLFVQDRWKYWIEATTQLAGGERLCDFLMLNTNNIQYRKQICYLAYNSSMSAAFLGREFSYSVTLADHIYHLYHMTKRTGSNRSAINKWMIMDKYKAKREWCLEEG